MTTNTDQYLSILRSIARARRCLADSYELTARFAYESLWSPWNRGSKRGALVRRRRQALLRRDEALALLAQAELAIAAEEQREAEFGSRQAARTAAYAACRAVRS